MIWLDWDKLPKYMQTEEVRPYYDILAKKKFQLELKRAFDFMVALIMMIFLVLPMLFIAIWI